MELNNLTNGLKKEHLSDDGGWRTIVTFEQLTSQGVRMEGASRTTLDTLQVLDLHLKEPDYADLH